MNPYHTGQFLWALAGGVGLAASAYAVLSYLGALAS